MTVPVRPAKKGDKHPGYPLGVNQLKILAALMEGPLHGLYTGPRPALAALDMNLDWVLPRKQRRPGRPSLNDIRSTSAATRKAILQRAIAGLLARGFITKSYEPGSKPDGSSNPGNLRSVFQLTRAGLNEYRKQTDESYRHELYQRLAAERAKKTATYQRWIRTPGAILGGIEVGKRWVAKRYGWQIILNYDPVDGWRFMMRTPDGKESDWTVCQVQEESPSRREAEATWRHYAELMSQKKEEPPTDHQ